MMDLLKTRRAFRLDMQTISVLQKITRESHKKRCAEHYMQLGIATWEIMISWE